MPISAAIIPPPLNESFEGAILLKAFAGAITFAAILVLKVAMIMNIWAITTTTGFSNLPRRVTGSHGASSAIRMSGKLISAAQVTNIPTKENKAIVPGRPMNCPTTWFR